MQLQHQVTYRNGAIKHIFYTNQIHGGITAQIVLYSFCRSMRFRFHLAVKYYFKSSSEDLSTLAYIHLSVVFPSRNASRTALCYATKYY